LLPYVRKYGTYSPEMERGIKEGIYNNVIDMKVRNYFSSYSHSGFSALISNKLFERDNQTE
jgi:hypothetical protein